MSYTHELKCWPGHFDAIERGEKTFEVRKNDRGFQVGDFLMLQRWRPGIGARGLGEYVDRNDRLASPWFEIGRGAFIRVRVTYVLHGGQFGIDPAWCVLGFAKVVEAGGE